MFTLIKTKNLVALQQNEQRLENKIAALEDYFNVKFYNGKKCKPHYRRVKGLPVKQHVK